MPLIFFPLTDSGNLILWKITESVKELMGLLIENNRHDLLPNENFRLDKRRLEWLAVRCALISSPLLRQENIIYNELGKPFLKNGTCHLSISHSFPYVCLFFHESQNIGVDIEIMTERILKIAPKFINEQEIQWLTKPLNIEELYLIWSAKEAFFKMRGGGGIDFRKNMTINSVKLQKQGKITLTFSKESKSEVANSYYRFLDNMILVYTIASDTR